MDERKTRITCDVIMAVVLVGVVIVCLLMGGCISSHGRTNPLDPKAEVTVTPAP